MIQATTGLVLLARPLTETSLVVHWLTADFGRIATVAKGARRPKSHFLGKLDLFYLADFSFSRSRGSDLHILREVKLRDLHASLRENIPALRQAAYAAALIKLATETETPLPAIFDMLRNFLDHLCRHKTAPQTVLAFELKLLQETGMQPDWDQTNLAAGTRKIADALSRLDWPGLMRLKLTHSQTDELARFLDGFLILHLGRLPQGRAAALKTEGLK
jgi:DNA repair protein RecO (recombination protein O)